MSSAETYYSRRAGEYESIYHRDDPVRQRELADIADAMKALLVERAVLEVACGTGYWSNILAQVVESLVAVDISPKMLAVAQAKFLPPGKVRFVQRDAHMLGSDLGMFNGGAANFWFSHVSKARVNEFLDGFHVRLLPGACVFMADNIYLPGFGGELVVHEGVEDTFKLRTLNDGSKYEVLKNYYAADQLEAIFGGRGNNLRIHIGECFWWLSYTT